jgi:hypothetical protein
VGLLFTTACVLPAWSRSHTDLVPWLLFATGAFFVLLAWLNCHAIEQWESAPTSAGRPQVFLLGMLLALSGFLLAAILLPIQPRPAALTAAGAASALLLALLDRNLNRFTPLALRAAADLVLLTPVLLVPLTPLLR